MSRLQNKVAGTPMTQRERKAWKAAKDRRELIGKGSAHAEEHDRVGQSVPVHEGQYRPVQLLDLERREKMLGMPKGGGEGMGASSSPPPAVPGVLIFDNFLRGGRPIENATRCPIFKEVFNSAGL